MHYVKASFNLSSDNQANREILMAYLSQLDFESFDDSGDHFLAFYRAGAVSPKAIEQSLLQLPFQVRFLLEEMPDINWNEKWEKNDFQPLLINNQVLIRAPYHKEFPKAQYEIVIEPNRSFGTGTHETTNLMMQHLSEIPLQNCHILDMGCGTGILGIYASMLGAKTVMAIDIDRWSFEATMKNSKLNEVNNLDVFIGDAQLLGNKQFDIVLANIHKNTILQDVEKYIAVLNDEGILIASGFYEHDLEEIIGKMSEFGLRKFNLKEQNKWVACAFQK